MLFLSILFFSLFPLSFTDASPFISSFDCFWQAAMTYGVKGLNWLLIGGFIGASTIDVADCREAEKSTQHYQPTTLHSRMALLLNFQSKTKNCLKIDHLWSYLWTLNQFTLAVKISQQRKAKKSCVQSKCWPLLQLTPPPSECSRQRASL